ncbi:MAG: methyltransferase domain-containing protein [Gallionella sp.]
MKDVDQPYRENPLLRISYGLIAPFYDLIVEGPLKRARSASLGALPSDVAGEVLISGAGTGLDLPLLSGLHRYTALDFNRAMLSRGRKRRVEVHVDWVLGDSMALPFAAARFDHVVLHLILAVVPNPSACLGEAARVVKPGGTILVFDKFLQPGKKALLRRALTPLSRRLATRMDVVFEQVLGETPQLQLISDIPLLANGWFRGIVLQKQ